jgi:hypothetical protein
MTIKRIQVKETQKYYGDFDGTLEDIISSLQAELDAGWAGLESEYDYDNQKEYYLYKERLETDEEYNLRMSEEQSWKEHRRKQYEQLKKEFEND